MGESAGADRAVSRAGFVGLAGRPNAGKSTLVNAIVGSQVAITSVRPQTTRRAIRGVATDPVANVQMVLVDLPGVQRPRDELTSRMQHRVEHELAGADVVLLVINGEEGVGPGDRFIAGSLLAGEASPEVICAVNKEDRLGRGVVPVLAEAAGLPGVSEVFPVSALRGTGLPRLVARLQQLMPEGPFMYPPEDRSDQPLEQQLAELIRGAALIRTRQEIPHSLEAKVTGIERREDGLWRIEARIWVESESQKRILIGRGGRKVREIGAAARKDLERELGDRVHLDLRIEVRHRWRQDDSLLDRLGID